MMLDGPTPRGDLPAGVKVPESAEACQERIDESQAGKNEKDLAVETSTLARNGA